MERKVKMEKKGNKKARIQLNGLFGVREGWR